MNLLSLESRIYMYLRALEFAILVPSKLGQLSINIPDIILP